MDSGEIEVRKIIRDTISDFDTSVNSDDFEFMEANGKNSAHQPGFEWTGRAVKELAGYHYKLCACAFFKILLALSSEHCDLHAGTGAVYVHLTVERNQESSDGGDSTDSATEPDVKIVKVENIGIQ